LSTETFYRLCERSLVRSDLEMFDWIVDCRGLRRTWPGILAGAFLKLAGIGQGAKPPIGSATIPGSLGTD
jgi:hypothetical protein